MTRGDVKKGAVFDSRRYGRCVITEVVVEGMSGMCLFLDRNGGHDHVWFYDSPTTQHLALNLRELTLVEEGS